MTAPNQTFIQCKKPQKTAPYTPVSVQCKPHTIPTGANYKHKVVILSQKVYILGKLTNVFSVMSISLGKTFRENSRAVALAAALTLATPFAANANDAAADSADIAAAHVSTSVTATTVSVPEVTDELREAYASVRMNDSRKFRKEVNQTGTARASNDAMALSIYGRNKTFMNDAVLATYRALQEDAPIRGIVVGSIEEPEDFDLYVDGVRVTLDGGLAYLDLVNAERAANGQEPLDLVDGIKMVILDSQRYLQPRIAMTSAPINAQ